MPNISNRASHGPTGPDHTAHPLVAAVGDTNRHDYGAGPAVLQHLDSRGLDVDLVSCAGETVASADFWRDRDPAILVEPVCAQPCHPGRVHQMVAARPGGGRLIVFAVEVCETADGPGLSAAVAAGARRVADAIAAEVAATQTPSVGPRFARRGPLSGRPRGTFGSP